MICDVSLLCMEQLSSMIPASTVEDTGCSSEIPSQERVNLNMNIKL